MTRRRLDFASADPAGFARLREQWRRAATGAKLPKVAHRIASVLPDYVNRECGYVFPTDQQLADLAKCSTRLIGKGMVALEKAGLIERKTIPRRDDKGEAAGRIRRIFLTLPSERNPSGSERNTSEVNGTNRVSERNNVFRITPDSNNLAREKNSKTDRVEREDCPVTYRGDDAFLDEFDRAVLDLAGGRALAAGELSGLVQEAFDATTRSSDSFMPFYWADVCNLKAGTAEQWFIRRAGQVLRARAC